MYTKTQVGSILNLSRQAISYRMFKLGITSDKISDYELELIKKYEPNHRCRRVTFVKREALIWEYYTKTKHNQVPQVAKALCLSVGYVGNVISKIQKRGYILLPSKLNEL